MTYMKILDNKSFVMTTTDNNNEKIKQTWIKISGGHSSSNVNTSDNLSATCRFQKESIS